MSSLRLFFSRWQNILGFVLVLFFIFVAIAAPVISEQSPKSPAGIKIVGRSTDLEPHPPSREAPLGTLSEQVDVFHSLVWGTRSALIFGLIVTVFVMFIGVFIGTTSAYFRGFFGGLLMKISDTFLAFPVLAGAVLIQQLITIAIDTSGVIFYSGSAFMLSANGEVIDLTNQLPPVVEFLHNLDPILIAFIIFLWVPYARVMYTSVSKTMRQQYVVAARASGSGHLRIMFRHLIPNSIAPVIVLAAKDIGAMVVLQAAFYFIGFGQGSPWAMILVRGRDWIYNPGGIFTFWWVFLPATVVMVLFGIGWNLLGDGLNDALNPRLS